MEVRRGDVAAMKCLYANPPDPEMEIWAAWLRPGDLFVDVGANSGAYTLWAADLGANVIAIEPSPKAYRQLRKNLDLNGYRVEVIAAAAGDRSGMITVTADLGTMNHLSLDSHLAGDQVPMITLDDVIGDRDVAGVKVDVEGAERLVLNGATRALREHRIRLLQLEWNSSCWELMGESREPVRILLESMGYALARPGSTTLEIGDRDIFAMPMELVNPPS